MRFASGRAKVGVFFACRLGSTHLCNQRACFEDPSDPRPDPARPAPCERHHWLIFIWTTGGDWRLTIASSSSTAIAECFNIDAQLFRGIVSHVARSWPPLPASNLQVRHCVARLISRRYLCAHVHCRGRRTQHATRYILYIAGYIRVDRVMGFFKVLNWPSVKSASCSARCTCVASSVCHGHPPLPPTQRDAERHDTPSINAHDAHIKVQYLCNITMDVVDAVGQ